MISRKEALARGLKKYFTGKPCKHGHVNVRYVNNGSCYSCLLASNARRDTADPEGTYRRHRRARLANPEIYRATARRYYARYPESRNVWARKHPDRYAAARAVGHAKRKNPNAIPPDFNLTETVRFYVKARRLSRETGIPHEVDHIVSLYAGGMHCPTNLQVLTKAENRAKGG